jgi:chemotaxis family two-component system sensor kinase Cph1
MKETKNNFCDRIQLSQFSDIQSYAGIFVIDKNFHIIQHSENMPEIIQTPIKSILHKDVSRFFVNEKGKPFLKKWISGKNKKYETCYWAFEKIKIKIWLYGRISDEGVVLKVEKVKKHFTNSAELSDLKNEIIKKTTGKIQFTSIKKLLDRTCAEIKRITGYDRVMVYELDPNDYSGVVISEKSNKNMDSYLGLHFPETDMPLHVRRMYINMQLRYIPSIYSPPSRIIPKNNPITKKPLDLVYSNIRTVAPVHIEYLKNMGIAATISIGIVIDNQLWGVIACHHKEEKYIPPNIRNILMLLADLLSYQIDALKKTSEVGAEKKVIKLQTSLFERMSKKGSLFDVLMKNYSLILNFVSAEGMCVYIQNKLIGFGKTPKNEYIKQLIKYANTKKIKRTVSIDSRKVINKIINSKKNKTSGVLIIPFLNIKNNYLFFFRPEKIKTVHWAGNPNNAVTFHAKAYSPRRSFEEYIQSISGMSEPWRSEHIKAAEYVCMLIMNRQLQDLIEVQAVHDPLTGLLNRLYLENQLKIEIQIAVREKKPLSILLIDLDFFKRVNDKYGHQAGDDVLSKFAKFLIKSLRGYDSIYRYGGEEFLIFLPGVTKDQAKKRAEILKSDFKNRQHEFFNKKIDLISFSGGVAAYPENGKTVNLLISIADKNLYRAKHKGRDRIEVTK